MHPEVFLREGSVAALSVPRPGGQAMSPAANDPLSKGQAEVPEAGQDSQRTVDEPSTRTPPAAAGVGTSIRCPYCHNPIRLADDNPDEVLCPVCGSNFRVQDTRITTMTSGMRQIGKFQLLERVGVGGFGAVWRARDTELDRLVALKLAHAGMLEHRFQPVLPRQVRGGGAVVSEGPGHLA
jgi:hypothetical protein